MVHTHIQNQMFPSVRSVRSPTLTEDYRARGVGCEDVGLIEESYQPVGALGLLWLVAGKLLHMGEVSRWEGDRQGMISLSEMSCTNTVWIVFSDCNCGGASLATNIDYSETLKVR